MGRGASAGDNAALESWHTYNRRWRQRDLGKLTPVEFELAFTNQAAAVAARSPITRCHPNLQQSPGSPFTTAISPAPAAALSPDPP